ncbi:hypothetical protein BCR34DRAFT_599583 [Clohesyomyces aquaticus]|uniref:Uncharacterized protein n=1 Tax=Clohesyomyces aquaticus TaxID=1231657 RepID=A0A1Y1ZU91_9PLEO|nr:hypothetical protein BCR34DRAFT_599583 [Clohesyomyces aquaticus]
MGRFLRRRNKRNSKSLESEASPPPDQASPDSGPVKASPDSMPEKVETSPSTRESIFLKNPPKAEGPHLWIITRPLPGDKGVEQMEKIAWVLTEGTDQYPERLICAPDPVCINAAKRLRDKIKDKAKNSVHVVVEYGFTDWIISHQECRHFHGPENMDSLAEAFPFIDRGYESRFPRDYLIEEDAEWHHRRVGSTLFQTIYRLKQLGNRAPRAIAIFVPASVTIALTRELNVFDRQHPIWLPAATRIYGWLKRSPPSNVHDQEVGTYAGGLVCLTRYPEHQDAMLRRWSAVLNGYTGHMTGELGPDSQVSFYSDDPAVFAPWWFPDPVPSQPLFRAFRTQCHEGLRSLWKGPSNWLEYFAFNWYGIPSLLFMLLVYYWMYYEISTILMGFLGGDVTLITTVQYVLFFFPAVYFNH